MRTFEFTICFFFSSSSSTAARVCDMKFLLKVYEASLSSLTCSLNLLIARALKFRDCVEYKYIFGSADVVPSKAVKV